VCLNVAVRLVLLPPCNAQSACIPSVADLRSYGSGMLGAAPIVSQHIVFQGLGIVHRLYSSAACKGGRVWAGCGSGSTVSCTVHFDCKLALAGLQSGETAVQW
jgi:hypothetical protein